MTKRTDAKNVDISYLEFSDEFDRKWNSNSSNEESVFGSKSEVLWSREKNENFSDNDFFRGFHDSFSDLTERTSSTCSWHNDDFDMNSSNKVKASLEAIEDALYENKQSHLISESVFKECCDWGKKFSYFRLSGEQIVKPKDDSVVLYTTEESDEFCSDHPSLGLQVQGKKMAIHVPEKIFKRIFYENDYDNLNKEPDCIEEIFDNDGEYEECLALDTSRDTCNKDMQSHFLNNETPNAASIEAIQEKIVERIALEMWPKVLAVLQKKNEPSSHDIFEDFQLPPIAAAVQQRKVPPRRPRTEGTDLLMSDFPKLSSILTISPKVLQNKQDSGNWRTTLKSSRPNSEIHLSCRNYTVPGPRRKNEPLKFSSSVSQLNNFRQIHPTSTKPAIKVEKEHLNVSSLLPAVEEDIPEFTDVLKRFSLESDLKEKPSTRYETTHLAKKSECFLPPIEGKTPVPANVKLTRNLFTFFGSPLKFDKQEGNVSTIRPTSRPNTSTSKKAFKFSGNTNNKFLNEGNSSLNSTNLTDTKKSNEANSDKQVTLFPIVTSLATYKEKNFNNVEKGLLNTFTSGKRR